MTVALLWLRYYKVYKAKAPRNFTCFKSVHILIQSIKSKTYIDTFEIYPQWKLKIQNYITVFTSLLPILSGVFWS